MLSEQVTAKDGSVRTVYADSKDELSEAVSAVKNQDMPTYPNINHPVEKGHDLVETQPDMSTKLVDGTGAHNSPNDAVQGDGKTDGDVPVLGMDEPAEKKQGDPGNVRPAVEQSTSDKANTANAGKGSNNTAPTA